MGIRERRARQKSSLRRQILDAARQMFAEEGYERVSMRRLAARIEYSPTAIYLYFKDKDELFRAICDETSRRWRGASGNGDGSSTPTTHSPAPRRSARIHHLRAQASRALHRHLHAAAWPRWQAGFAGAG
jgi:AcrR family transcriptional regulator